MTDAIWLETVEVLISLSISWFSKSHHVAFGKKDLPYSAVEQLKSLAAGTDRALERG